jgi:multiple sugar transport system ATP-binding protein
MAIVTLKNVIAGPIKSALDLAVGDREFVVLSGPADSGVSAIVRLIAGLERVSEGEILFDDRKVNGVLPKDRDVALLARDYVPYPRLSVFDNLAIGLRRKKFAETEIQKRIASVAVALGLQAQLPAKAERLSREQRCFIGLARAMVRRPGIFLFDDPFADIDPQSAGRGRAEIVKLQQRSSATIVYATTMPAEAIALGQRTIVVIDGVIQQDALSQNIYDAPANLAVAQFFGDPPMNLVGGTLKQERAGVVFSEGGDGTIAVPLAPDRFADAKNFLSKRVVLGCRPEDIEIDSPATDAKQADGSFRALVERAEPRGAATDLYLQTGGHSLVASQGGSGKFGEEGHRLRFRIAMEKAHLFEAETGLRVTSEP